jgi:hypothetical protein
MLKVLLQLLKGTLTRWAKRLHALATSRIRALLIGGIGVVSALILGLVYHTLFGPGAETAKTTQLLSAYHKNWLIALAFFGAAAAGYTYWALQVIAEDSPAELRRRIEFASALAFLGAVGWAIMALLLWNVGLLLGTPGLS